MSFLLSLMGNSLLLSLFLGPGPPRKFLLLFFLQWQFPLSNSLPDPPPGYVLGSQDDYVAGESETMETGLSFNPDTGKYDETAVRLNCEGGGMQQGETYLSYKYVKDHFDDYYNSGAEVYVGTLAKSIMVHHEIISSVCPLVVMQAYLIELENTMVMTYTDAYSEIAVQQKRLRQSANIVSRFQGLYERLKVDVGMNGLQRLTENWKIVEGWDRAEKYRRWFHEDINAGRDFYANHLSDEVNKQGNLTDQEFADYFRETFRSIADIFTNKLKLEWWPIRGTLISLMRYGANGALSDFSKSGDNELHGSHPDFKENDIDVIIAVENEKEWSSLQKEITLTLEKWSPEDLRCFVKTTVQPEHSETAAGELFAHYNFTDKSVSDIINPETDSEFSTILADKNIDPNSPEAKEEAKTYLQAAYPFAASEDNSEKLQTYPLPIEYFRKDLIYCIKTKPATMLIDVNSYVKDRRLNIGYGHRTFRQRAKRLRDWGDSHTNVQKLASEGNVHVGGDVDNAKGGSLDIHAVHDVDYNDTDYVIHPHMGAFRNAGTNFLTLDMLAPSKKCKVFDFTVPCNESPDLALHAMLIEGGMERTCFALPGEDRLSTWEDADWNRFLDNQDFLREEGERTGEYLSHMGPYLVKYCWEMIVKFASKEVQNRISETNRDHYGGWRAALGIGIDEEEL